jgi:hypothetical protein
MALNHQEIALIKSIDRRVKRMVSIGYQDREILNQMIGYAPQVKDILSSNDEIQLDMYISSHEGFYHYIKLVEDLAVNLVIKKSAINKKM